MLFYFKCGTFVFVAGTAEFKVIVTNYYCTNLSYFLQKQHNFCYKLLFVFSLILI